MIRLPAGRLHRDLFPVEGQIAAEEHIYRQAENVHLEKLEAFLALYKEGMSPAAWASWRLRDWARVLPEKTRRGMGVLIWRLSQSSGAGFLRGGKAAGPKP